MMKHNSFLAVSMAIATTVTLPRSASAQCEPEWMPGSGVPGTALVPSRMLRWDPDGPGPRSEVLIVAGINLYVAGNVRATFAAMLDGSRWSSMDEGLSGFVTPLAAVYDGTRSSVYAIGLRDDAKSDDGPSILTWTGARWTRVPGDFTPLPEDTARLSTFEAFDDGSGPALFVAGAFSNVDSVPANNIVKWNGSTWSPVGNGIESEVGDMLVFDNGSGPALYASSACRGDKDYYFSCIMRWDGEVWTQVPGEFNGGVSRLAAFDDGSGPGLVASGYFTRIGNLEAFQIARWDGVAWSNLGSGVLGVPVAMVSFDGGFGSALYVVGRIHRAGDVDVGGVAKWDGKNWESLGAPSLLRGRDLAVYDTGIGPRLFISGYGAFGALATWDGSKWGNATPTGTDGAVHSATTLARGSGPELCATGRFTILEGTPAKNVACWNGGNWTALGSGIEYDDLFSQGPRSVASFDAGTGSKLFVGGDLSWVDDQRPYSVVAWNGTTWSPVGNGLPGACSALRVFNDRSGSRLFAGGAFVGPDGTFQSGVAVWNGTTWSIPGSGLPAHVTSFTEFDDGRGLALFAGGFFSSAGGAPTPGVARWDGNEWRPVGSLGVAPTIYVLQAFDDGTGSALYAAGSFSSIDGTAAALIARWNGASWSAVGGGLPTPEYSQYVAALTVHDDGRGPALFATGSFPSAGGVPAHGIARWDGTAWTTLGEGLSYEGYALQSFDDGGGPTLFVGGNFLTAGPHVSASLARWKCRCQHCDTDGDGDVDTTDFRSFATCLTGPQTPPPPRCAPHRLDSGLDIDLADFALLQNEFAP